MPYCSPLLHCILYNQCFHRFSAVKFVCCSVIRCPTGEASTNLPFVLLFPPVMSEEESRPAQPPATAGKGVWPGLPESELKTLWEAMCPQGDVAEGKKRPLIDGEGSRPAEEVSSKKSTIAHEAVVRGRDEAFQVRGSNFAIVLA